MEQELLLAQERIILEAHNQGPPTFMSLMAQNGLKHNLFHPQTLMLDKLLVQVLHFIKQHS
jgi:hypothetical protein